MKISIIIPAFITTEKGLADMKKLVSKLISQRKTNHEIIIIDDCSPMQFKLVNNFTYFRFDTNGGVARARNKGLELSSGSDYIAFVDSDDDITDNFLSELDRFAESKADIIYFKCQCEDGSNNYHEPCAWGKLVKRSYIGDRKFDVKYNIGEEDTLFKPLQNARKPSLAYADSSIYRYRWSANPDSLMKRFWRNELPKIKG